MQAYGRVQMHGREEPRWCRCQPGRALHTEAPTGVFQAPLQPHGQRPDMGATLLVLCRHVRSDGPFLHSFTRHRSQAVLIGRSAMQRHAPQCLSNHISEAHPCRMRS